MRVIKFSNLENTDRETVCPRGGFTSLRALLHRDGMGFSLHLTKVPPGEPQEWHYPHHLEACVCIKGKGTLVSLETGDSHEVVPGTVYALDQHDRHQFTAHEPTELISVFNPPVVGSETHDAESKAYPPSPASPVYSVRPVPVSRVKANDYNPNRVAPPEMELLRTSIMEDGYTQPVVTFRDPESGDYIVVDGFHRYLTLVNTPELMEREDGMLPVVVIEKEMGDRMASTIRHNRARGTHNVELMSSIVSELVEMGKGDRWICKHIGMSADELLRLKQITGLASLFKERDFSESWEAELELDDDSIETT